MPIHMILPVNTLTASIDNIELLQVNLLGLIR